MPVTIEPKFKKSPAELKLDHELVSLDVSRLPLSTITRNIVLCNDDAHDDDEHIWLATKHQRLQKKLKKKRTPDEPIDQSGGALSIAWEWSSHEKLSVPAKEAFDTITKALMAHITTPSRRMDSQTLQELKSSFKVALGKDEVATLFDVLLRHIVNFYPRFCNPQVSRGSDALYKLVDIISYLTSYEFEKMNDYKVTVEQINLVFSDYCTHAYPYPINGIAPFQRILRYLFVCFNTFALHLADKKLMTDTLPANKAIEAMNLVSPCCVNHESVLIGSQWVKRCAQNLLGKKDELIANWVFAWKHIVGRQSEYIELAEKYSDFRQHESAIKAARLAMEAMQHFEDNLNKITFYQENSGQNNLFSEIRRVRQEMLSAKGENERKQLEVELWEKMEAVDGQFRNKDTARQADDLIRALKRRWKELHQR
ncbi:hypothetical protein F5X99DRAFT_412673 [Biscogniauxia marginata]|nr:hypothetical protein F5X99DRAFT_412673 [Biscogniauxia marginata]